MGSGGGGGGGVVKKNLLENFLLTKYVAKS